MSLFIAKVKAIQSVENLNIVKFECDGITLSMMSLELSEQVKVGTSVKLSTKPTHVAIAKNISGDLSYSNQLHVEVLHVENGELLTSLKLKFNGTIFESIITKDSSDRMALHVGDKVIALIKANELSIKEILDART